ncbi:MULTISPECIES: CBS domain-containing protein [unclassified Nocardioides]|uniref:CBS domain-containing protein n=1 Tax=unclassified Nocardioides TaxID=2615069 RepID=UPI00361886D6
MQPGRATTDPSTAATVRGAMLHHPTVHPAEMTVGEARSAFATSAKNRLLLLVADGLLVSAVDRDDLSGTEDPSSAVAALGSLDGRCVSAEAPLRETFEEMLRTGRRRFAVVDGDGALLGLLCLKRSRSGFCTDEGVAAMRRARRS